MSSVVVRSFVTAVAATGLGIAGPSLAAVALLFADGLPQRLEAEVAAPLAPKAKPPHDLAWLDEPALAAPGQDAGSLEITPAGLPAPPARRAAGASPSGPTPPVRATKRVVPTGGRTPAPAAPSAQKTRAVNRAPNSRTVPIAPPACNRQGRCRVR